MPFTPAQQSAIEARNRELLVSAAAGSGKTAVLVERIYSLIHDDGYSIDRMLVVTFTHAAAAEMRERLETRLSEAAEGNRDMHRQAELVETAQISTLHSLCQSIVREHFETVDIDPQASLCDERQSSALLWQALTDALREAYEQAAEDENIRALTRKFTQSEIETMLQTLYQFLLARPEPFAWLDSFASHAYTQEDLQSGPMAETLLHDCRILLDGAMAIWTDAQAQGNSPFLRDSYAVCLKGDGVVLQSLLHASDESLPALLTAVDAVNFGRMPSLRLSDPAEIEAKEQFQKTRDRYKALIKDMKKILPADANQSMQDLQAMQPALRGLAHIVKEMHQRFAELKTERALLDFSDLEHMALTILSQTELQKKISARYDAIFVDEYQDISGIQEALLTALKRTEDASFPLEEERKDVATEKGKAQCPHPLTCFFVGDVKQSIYRFRQADPTLFMEKQNHFAPDAAAPQRKITLNHNFRSRGAVLDAVNRVFSHVMREEVTEIEYDEDARLHAGLPSQNDPSPTLHIIDSKELRSAQQPRAEAETIAVEIQKLVGQPTYDREGQETGLLHYRDIAILLPAAKGVAPTVEKVLTEAGIPVYSEDSGAGLESPEIVQALVHLRLLDNLMDDLSLLAVLRGPLYQWTEESLAHVRLNRPERNASYLEAMMATANASLVDSLSIQCRYVLEDLRHERFLLHSMPLDEYLWSFLSRSGMYSFYGAQPGGKLRQANLRMLCTRASEHVANRGGDVHDFLDTVSAGSGVRDGRSPSVLSPWEDVVRIMTIHKSKGLEFPLVFVMGLGSPLERRGAGSSSILSLHPKLGVALRYINEKARTKRDTLLRSAISLRTRAENKAERARLLYVALTRARDQLIMVGCSSSITPEGIASHSTPFSSLGGGYAVWEAKSMLDWIAQTLKKQDNIRVCDENDFSTEGMREKQFETHLSTNSTCFPQKTGVWEVVFHIPPAESSTSGTGRIHNAVEAKEIMDSTAKDQWMEGVLTAAHKGSQGDTGSWVQDTAVMNAAGVSLGQPAPDPLAPKWTAHHAPLKLGVTALCRSLEEAEQEALAAPEEDVENSETKRLPLSVTKPRLLADLPSLPAYLRGSEEQTGLLRGVATHKALSLLPLEPLRLLMVSETGEEMPVVNASFAQIQRAIHTELQLLAQDGRITPEEEALVRVDMLAKFFASGLGKRALSAQELHREWSFNLRLPELSESILQGIIDLCFLEDGQWVLVDYKTDRVKNAQELWKLYGRQVDIYQRALSAATHIPVRESVLFALRLGEAAVAVG